MGIAKLDLNGYAPSIMQDDTSFCYACGKRAGKLDASIYCRKCGCFGRRVKSEELDIPSFDTRNEIPTKRTKEIMREAALEAWNRRANDV